MSAVRKKKLPRKVVVQVEGVEDVDSALLEEKVTEGVQETLGDEAEVDVEVVDLPSEGEEPYTNIKVGVVRGGNPVSVAFAEVDSDGDQGQWIVHEIRLQEAEFLLEELADAIRRTKARQGPEVRLDPDP